MRKLKKLKYENNKMFFIYGEITVSILVPPLVLYNKALAKHRLKLPFPREISCYESLPLQCSTCCDQLLKFVP